MEDITKGYILLIIFLFLLNIDYNYKYKECIVKTPLISFELALHRAVYVFNYTGWMFNNKFILIFYILFDLALFIHWTFNDWKCCLTVYENDVCNFPKGTMYDYIYQTFDKNTSNIITITLKIAFICIAIYKIIYF